MKEDIGAGDVTTRFFVPLGTRFYGEMRAKDSGIVCGLGVVKRVFDLAAPGSRVQALVKDGSRIKKGGVLMKIEGPASILTAERTALNFLQHMSGVATRAALFSSVIKNARTKIYDTRKTLPGLRAIEKYAVTCGGASNHRMGLHDMAMIKDNHVAFAGGHRGVDITRSLGITGSAVTIAARRGKKLFAEHPEFFDMMERID